MKNTIGTEEERMMSCALLPGLIRSGLWMASVYVIMKCYPWEMLHDYPEDVRKAIEEDPMQIL